MNDDGKSPWTESLVALVVSWRRRALAFTKRHRTGVVLAGVAALALVVRLILFGSGFHEPTSSDPVGRLAFSADTGGTVTLEFDQRSGWTSVTDSRLEAPTVFVHEDSLYFQDPESGQLVTMPSSKLFPPPVNLDPKVLALSFDRGPRECTVASLSEAALLRYFFKDAELSTPLSIRGETTFVDVTGDCPVQMKEEVLDELVAPAPESAESIYDTNPQIVDAANKMIEDASRLWNTP